jgi:UDP-glucose 4-epimerase
MKIFVTGGAGFIGKNLIKLLAESNHKITIFDNFSNSSKDSIIHLLQNNVKIIEGDITNFEELNLVIKNHDILIHLAAKISVNESIKNPDETFYINVEGTKNVVTACLKNNIKKIIIASSAAVYGDSSSSEIKLSEDSKKNPISPYGKSKMIMEQYIEKKLSTKKIDYAILRFFNIFGIGQSNEYAGVITKFGEKILHNKDIQIFGDGKQTRDFVAIEDVIEAINLTINTKLKNGIYNIGSGHSITINNLAKLMISKSNKGIGIRNLDSKKGEIKHSQADITSAKKNIGYKPKISIENKINDFLNNFTD